jgi:phosphoglycolate phosphatase-like HAD superfamily hydrolase
VDFVRATTSPHNPKFVPQPERIATFDQDGTLWVEHPLYSQLMYCLDRVLTVVNAKPELANVEPFKTVLFGNREAIAHLSTDDLLKIATATLTGMPVATFRTEAMKWIVQARDARWTRPYTELTYEPMQEVLKYLRANGYKTYIVTGGGQDFVRVYSERVYGIPPEQVVGTAGGTKYAYDANGKPFLTKDRGPAQRQRRRQTGGDPHDDRATASLRVRQFHGDQQMLEMHRRGRRGSPDDARPATTSARCNGLPSCPTRVGFSLRAREERLDRHQHENDWNASSPSSADVARQRGGLLLCGVVAAPICLAAAALWYQRTGARAEAQAPQAVAAMADARYVGSGACVTCHRSEAAEWRASLSAICSVVSRL